MLCDKKIVKIKGNISKTGIRPAKLCGSEIWASKKSGRERKLMCLK